MKMHAVLALALAAGLLAGCASKVKLDDVPVEDKSAVPVTSNRSSASTQPRVESRVAQVTVDPRAADLAGPNGVGKVVYFDFDSYVIKPEFQSVIESHARFLRGNAARKISVEGHTDEQGGREYNLALGQRRSEAVRRALTLLGVGDGQVEAVSFGEEKPAATGADESAWAKNRRAEIAYR